MTNEIINEMIIMIVPGLSVLIIGNIIIGIIAIKQVEKKEKEKKK